MIFVKSIFIIHIIKIVDFDDMNYEDRLNEYHELGPMKDRSRNKKGKMYD